MPKNPTYEELLKENEELRDLNDILKWQKSELEAQVEYLSDAVKTVHENRE